MTFFTGFGLFGRPDPTSPDPSGAPATKPITRARALMAVPMAICAAHHGLDLPRDTILRQLRGHPAFSALDERSLDSLYARLLRQLEGQGVEATLRAAVQQLTLSMRETALMLTLMVLLEAGPLEGAERDDLMELGEYMGVAPERFVTLFEALLTLRRCEM